MTVQAIAGVSPSAESRIMTVYPSISANVLGRLLGQLYACIPIRIGGMKLSTLLFGLPTAPIGAPLYLLTKVFGNRYTLTNRSVQIWASLGAQKLSSVELGQIDSVELEELSGQAFFRAADIRLKSADGKTLMRLAGVGDAGSFRNAIQRAIESRRMVQSSLSTIAARKV